MAKLNVTINTAARAVLPTGSQLSRAEVLTKLGLDPKTPPDAWLAIFGCGVNASALKVPDAKRMLNRGTISTRVLGTALLGKVQGGG